MSFFKNLFWNIFNLSPEIAPTHEFTNESNPEIEIVREERNRPVKEIQDWYQKPERKIDRVFIHCSASDVPAHDDVSVMREWHKARGWSDVGYHFFIKKNGELQKGRPLKRIPAAQYKNNTGTIAICCHGLRVDAFTEAQKTTLKNLCREICIDHSGEVTFHGHREVAAKACPVFSYKQWLNLNSAGEMLLGEKHNG